MVSKKGSEKSDLFFCKKSFKSFFSFKSFLVYLLYQPNKSNMTTKQEQMTMAGRLLAAVGLNEGQEYIWSLHGPTVILTVAGQAKMTKVKQSDFKTLTKLGIEFLGL
jgi:hypothetical protein